ncbi:MAG: alpha/beta hydrolase [Alphaproteobacteria bacterium]|nr:alpha/beta hydrolase [Alphaproteobacteria bacterium]
MFHYWTDGSTEAHDFSTILVGLFSEATQGAADPNELLRIASAIRAGNRADWTQAFCAMAERVFALGEDAVAQLHQQTACESFFRAFTYFRVAELMRSFDDPQKIPLYLRALESFKRGLSLSAHSSEPAAVNYGGHRLEGYFFKPQPANSARLARNGRAPCVIFLSGADALPEQNFFRGVQWLTARGLACLIFNGPGQGGTIRLLGVPTTPDYERPVAAAIDYLIDRTDVDANRIGLLGVSMAGYYAMRAAAFEPRIRAVVAWGAMYSVLDDLWRCYPPLRRQLVWIAGAKDEADAEARLKAFTLKGVLGRVRCPVLITHGVNDEMVPVASAQRTYEETAAADKTLRIYTSEEGGDTHINIDNWSQVIPTMADWLVERLD